MPDRVEIFEVGPRDGLQNEPKPIALEQKLSFVDLLSQVGFRRIEVASFVSPKWVPQMADSTAVLGQITRVAGVRYAALTPNLRGYQDAVAARADEVAIFASASEGFSKANLNATIAESLARFGPVSEAAQADGIPVRGYVSCVTDCPFDGPTPPEKVAEVAAVLRDMGCYEVSLGDTIGKGRPETIAAMLTAVMAEVPATQLAGHYHDTDGRALENTDVSLEMGIRVFDSAAGGLGGCPYAPGASGNVASEALARHLEQRGFETGLNLDLLEEAGKMAQEIRHV